MRPEPLPFCGGWGGGGLWLLSVRVTEGPTTDPIPVLTELSGQTLDSHMINPVISVVLCATKKVSEAEKVQSGVPIQLEIFKGRTDGEGSVHQSANPHR